jgi:hypothetical protein
MTSEKPEFPWFLERNCTCARVINVRKPASVEARPVLPIDHFNNYEADKRRAESNKARARDKAASSTILYPYQRATSASTANYVALPYEAADVVYNPRAGTDGDILGYAVVVLTVAVRHRVPLVLALPQIRWEGTVVWFGFS